VTARLVAAACLVAAAPVGAGAARPPVSLVASPAHVSLTGAARQTIRVANSGSESVVVDVARAAFALDLRGRPRIVARGSRSAASWLAIRPRRLTLDPGGSASLTVSSALPRHAEPGDHDALVLLTTRPRPGLGLAVRMRIGVVVVVRAPGAIVRRLELRRLRVRRAGAVRVLELLVANRGNVTEVLSRSCVIVSLRRGRRALTALRPTPRELRPRTSGIVEVRYRGRVRGRVIARVALSGRPPCAAAQHREFRIRL
jgi:hypothetical protein